MSYGSLVTLRTPKVKMLNTEGTAIGVAKRTKDGVNTPVLRNAESCLNLKIVLLGREITLHLCLVEGNPINNDRSNIMFLCRKHHVEIEKRHLHMLAARGLCPKP